MTGRAGKQRAAGPSRGHHNNAGVARREIVSYAQVHLRLRCWRGRPDSMKCIGCDGTAAQWAYLGGDPNELTDHRSGSKYSLDQTRYAPMCIPCHKRKDRATADGRSEDVCPRGHDWATNESIRRSRSRAGRTGIRFCRACHRENSLRYARARGVQPRVFKNGRPTAALVTA